MVFAVLVLAILMGFATFGLAVGVGAGWLVALFAYSLAGMSVVLLFAFRNALLSDSYAQAPARARKSLAAFQHGLVQGRKALKNNTVFAREWPM